MVAVRTLRGANFWSSRPLIRLDLEVGAFDEISSAEVPGVTEALLAELPGLMEHRCNIGERGGFVTRLRRGTYVPHVVEHLALELQSAIGHEVGFGRARGGDRPGEYTVVFQHRHAEVGLRAAAHALEVAQQAFSGIQPRVESALAELRWLATLPDVAPVAGEVLCGVTGSVRRTLLRAELLRRAGEDAGAVVTVSPGYVLQAGLPYARSATAVILDLDVADAPPRYREPEMARRLLSVLADAVHPGGWVVVPAADEPLLRLIREAGCRVAVMMAPDGPARDGAALADASAKIRAGEIQLTLPGGMEAAGPVREEAPADVQLAAALVASLTRTG